MLAYTDILNNRPGSDYKYMVDTYDEAQIAADIEAARADGADFVIVYMHWGVEHTHQPTHTQENMAEFIANAGADIILGSHSHCTQPFDTIETDRGGVPVLYSLGNFISSMAKTMHNDGVIVHLVLEKKHETNQTSLVSLTYTPTLCTNTDAGRFCGGAGRSIFDRRQRDCSAADILQRTHDRRAGRGCRNAGITGLTRSGSMVYDGPYNCGAEKGNE